MRWTQEVVAGSAHELRSMTSAERRKRSMREEKVCVTASTGESKTGLPRVPSARKEDFHSEEKMFWRVPTRTGKTIMASQKFLLVCEQ